MQFISTSRNLVNIWRSKTPRMRFSTIIIRHDPINSYEDWEYCQLITSQLKNNNCNQAISLLFQSYFNNQILDIQVYNQLFEKINQSSLALSYTQIVYLIYREHFPPHMLMKNWMNKLTHSKNQQLISKLRKDFQALGEKYPLRKSAKRELKQEQNIKQQTQIKFKPTKSEIQAFKNFLRVHRQQFPQTFDRNLQSEEIFRIKLSTQMKDILTKLNIKFSDHTELDVQGIQLQFFKYLSQQDKEPLELPSDEQYQFDHPIHNINMNDFFGVDLNKIKIQKIEINHKKYKW